MWNINIYEYVSTLLQRNIDLREILQIAGTSFDIGAKVYSLKVDDIYNGVLKLAKQLASLHQNKALERSLEDANSSERYFIITKYRFFKI